MGAGQALRKSRKEWQVTKATSVAYSCQANCQCLRRTRIERARPTAEFVQRAVVTESKIFKDRNKMVCGHEAMYLSYHVARQHVEPITYEHTTKLVFPESGKDSERLP